MLKLPNRSATALNSARKITEFFQPAQTVAVEASDRGSSTTRDASSSSTNTGGNNTTLERKPGMTAASLGQETRKRMRDGKAPERVTRTATAPTTTTTTTTATTAPDITKSPIMNGGLKPPPQHRALVAAAPVGESSNSSTRKKDGEEKRSLRSKAGGTRLKSNLATYFPNFEDVVAGVEYTPDFLAYDEPIQIVDTAQQGSRGKAAVPRVSTSKSSSQQNHFDIIDLSTLAPEPVNAPTIDPLSDSIFLPSHRRAERREKQLRNIEKERAQHEKGQLESLLESLQGPDWLRVMGVTGITDGARKDYEPRRDYFIREVKVLLRKFRAWKEAEKKLMLEKAARDEDDEEEEDTSGAEDDEVVSDVEDNDLSTDDPDAWAARQLRIEARSVHTKPRPQQRSRPKEKLPPKPPKPPEPPKPFTSFFDKPHLRQAALSKGRHSGRQRILAFGHPIPEIEEHEFYLPNNFMSKETLLANARKRRRMNREKKEAEAEADAKAKAGK